MHDQSISGTTKRQAEYTVDIRHALGSGKVASWRHANVFQKRLFIGYVVQWYIDLYVF